MVHGLARGSIAFSLGILLTSLVQLIVRYGLDQSTPCGFDKIQGELDPRSVPLRKARLLCYVNTHPAMYRRKAMHVQTTWGRRCDKLLFTSTVPYGNLSVMILQMKEPEVRSHLWLKMRKILRKLYLVAEEYDYFFKADDDTYSVVENLRAVLQSRSPNDSFMLGYRWNVLCPGGYFSGGAGYLLSRKALKRIVEHAIDKHPACPTTDEDKEDVKMCQCGRAVGVNMLDAFGETGKSLFSPRSPVRYSKYRLSVREMLNLSSRHISFHYVDGTTMYLMDFLIYFVRPFGLVANG